MSKFVNAGKSLVFVAKLASAKKDFYYYQALDSVTKQAAKQGLNPKMGHLEVVPPRRTNQGVMWYELHMRF